MRKKLGGDPFVRREKKEKHLDPFFKTNNSFDSTPSSKVPMIEISENNDIDVEQKIYQFIVSQKNAGPLRISRELDISVKNVLKILQKLNNDGKISLK